MKKIAIAALGFGLLAAAFSASALLTPIASKPNILVSNDDGIDAPGLAALVDRLSAIGRVTVAAPTQNFGGFGHAMTFTEPLPVKEFEKNGVKWFAIKATPPSCVRLAIEVLLPQRPDFTVAGINPGENTGIDIYYSATVACAREAAFLGIPGIAINMNGETATDYRPAADLAAAMLEDLLRKPMRPGVYLNVNVPGLPRQQIKGIMVTPQDLRAPKEYFERRVSPRGQVYYWNSYKGLEAGDRKTDVWAVRNGYVAITPLQLDQTDSAELKKLKSLETIGW